MFPFRYSSIFKSRWMALLWAGGIIWTALDVATPSHTKNASENSATTVDSADAPAGDTQMNDAEALLKKLAG